MSANMAHPFHWIEFPGYHEEFQLVDAQQRIIGVVRGSKFEKSGGWVAFDESAVPGVHLGRYRTTDAARLAVEGRLAQKAAIQSLVSGAEVGSVSQG